MKEKVSDKGNSSVAERENRIRHLPEKEHFLFVFQAAGALLSAGELISLQQTDAHHLRRNRTGWSHNVESICVRLRGFSENQQAAWFFFFFLSSHFVAKLPWYGLFSYSGHSNPILQRLTYFVGLYNLEIPSTIPPIKWTIKRWGWVHTLLVGIRSTQNSRIRF